MLFRSRAEENAITFSTSSPIANDLHPMRPKPKEAIEIEKEKAIAEREEKAEAKPVAPKKESILEHIKVAKPSLEKIIEKDGAVQEEAPLPEIEETGEIPQAPESAADKHKGDKHKGDKVDKAAADKHKGEKTEKAADKPKGEKTEKHKGEKTDKPKGEKHKTEGK